jgi:hypothetical protein
MIIAISGQAMGQSAGMSTLGSRSPIGGAATEWFSEHLLNPGARRVTQVAIHSASAQANSDIANV